MNTLTKLNTSGQAVIASTSDTGGELGITVAGAGTSGSALIATQGLVTCAFDGTAADGDYVQISSSTAGDCHDAGSTFPTSGGQIMGQVQSGGSGADDYTIALYSSQIQPSSGGGSGTSCPSPFSLSSNTGECYKTVSPATSSTNCTGSVACIYFTGLPSTINEYTLRCWNLLAGTSNSPGIQVYDGSWETASYHWAYNQVHPTSGNSGTGSESAAGVILQGMPTSASSNPGASLTFQLHGMAESAYHTFDGQDMTYVSSSTYGTGEFGWYGGGQNAVSGIRIVDTQSTPTAIAGTSAYCTLYTHPN